MTHPRLQQVAFDEIQEEIINIGRKEAFDRRENYISNAYCDFCLKRIEFVKGISINLSSYMCFRCNIYLCEKCFKKHKTHQHLNVASEASERETQVKVWFNAIRKETSTERREHIKKERKNVYVCDFVDVSHAKDMKGRKGNLKNVVCGLSNNRWVVCDSANSCIKIFKTGSNVLKRYIRFRAQPFKIVEVTVKPKPEDENSASVSHQKTDDMSTTDSSKKDKSCLIAVTLPSVFSILLIELCKTPATITKTIKMEKRSYGIDFCDDKIFTLCRDETPLYDFPYSVYVLSREGATLNIITTDIRGYIPDFTVTSGMVYLTDWYNHNVRCVNIEGEVISKIKITGSGPAGISVDPDKNVYVCVDGRNKVYKLDTELTTCTSILDQTSRSLMVRPGALCFYRDKLYIGHSPGSQQSKFITVVQLL